MKNEDRRRESRLRSFSVSGLFVAISLALVSAGCGRHSGPVPRETPEVLRDFQAQVGCGGGVTTDRAALYRALEAHAAQRPFYPAPSDGWLSRRASKQELDDYHSHGIEALNGAYWAPEDSKPSRELIESYLGKAFKGSDVVVECDALDTSLWAKGFLNALANERLEFPWFPANSATAERLTITNFYIQDGPRWFWRNSCLSLSKRSGDVETRGNDCFDVPSRLQPANP